ncbi:S-layer homology domain-containing protein [Bhargavaea cecembensis]|uniref:S-layer homology domain-containing protein n=1 Tax=Bhargavaea cecembensis TaxID=394098 RepID=UPI00058D3FEC|nr:S-layer homology domain-containing protein [Bhargavaea cecembensis]
MKKGWVAGAGAALLLAAGLMLLPGGQAEGDGQVNPMLYADVPLESSHFQNIMEARTLGLMTGYPDNKFGPSVKLNRANVVKAFGKYIEQTTGKKVSEFDLSGVEPFSDVPPDARDQELYQYSLLVKKEGIFQGSNNRLMPSEYISRRQMAMVLVRAFDLPDLTDVQSKVTDLSPDFGEEDRRAINILSKHRITTVSEFRPRETTSRGQFASFLVASYHAVHEEHTPPEVTGIEIEETENTSNEPAS